MGLRGKKQRGNAGEVAEMEETEWYVALTYP
jgi:hypothetical protein